MPNVQRDAPRSVESSPAPGRPPAEVEATPRERAGERGEAQQPDRALLALADLRSLVERIGSQGDEARLARIEEAVRDVATGTDSVLETVHGFEAMMSVGLMDRLDDLVDRKLTVLTQARLAAEKATARYRFCLAATALVALLLGLEIRGDLVSTGAGEAWQAVSVGFADAGDWLEDAAAKSTASI